MKLPLRLTAGQTPAWKDIAEDYLEIKGSLNASERGHLISALQKEGIRANGIHAPCCFSVGDYLAVVADKGRIVSIWIYDPRGKKIYRTSNKYLNRSSRDSRRRKN